MNDIYWGNFTADKITVQVYATFYTILLHWCFNKTLTKPNVTTFKAFPNEIQRLSRTLALCEDFSGLENKTKKFADFKEFQGPVGTLVTLLIDSRVEGE